MDLKELLKLYIKENFEDDFSFGKAKMSMLFSSEECFKESATSLDDYINNEKKDNSFQNLLFSLIDKKNLKDSEVYQKAGLDRRLFSKIRADGYHPNKSTIIRLALALELNEDEALSLLSSASYYLPKNNVFDLIIRFCFINKIYSIIKVNELLYENHCELI